jgi:hypothetical protein
MIPVQATRIIYLMVFVYRIVSSALRRNAEIKIPVTAADGEKNKYIRFASWSKLSRCIQRLSLKFDAFDDDKAVD